MDTTFSLIKVSRVELAKLDIKKLKTLKHELQTMYDVLMRRNRDHIKKSEEVEKRKKLEQNRSSMKTSRCFLGTHST